MTLTTAAVPPAAIAPPPGTTVQAVVLTSGSHAGLSALLDALTAQTARPDAVLVLESGAAAAQDARSADDVAAVVARARSEAFAVTHERLDARMPQRAALTRWLTSADLSEDTLLWLLPVGSLPEPGALAAQLAAHRRSPSVGIVGPKHVDATRPTVLRSIGILTTVTGRVIEDPPSGEPDQGQFDLRRDVIAVPLAGMLASVGVLRALRGWERSFGDLGGDLDLGWRAQLGGHRVIVAPDARVRLIAAAGLGTADTGARRRAARRVALTRASWWFAPVLALWILLSSVVAAVGLLLLKRPRAAADALADVGALDPVRGVAARMRTRGRRALRPRDIATLFVPGSVVVRRTLDRAHEALVAPGGFPDEGGTEAHERSIVSRAALHPGIVAVVAVLAVVVAAGRDIGGGLISRFGSGVTGGELITTRATSSTLWHAAFDGWHGTGFGSDGAASPSLAVLAVPTWIVEHLPGTGDLTSTSGAVIGALLVLTLPLAAVCAYLSARVLTDSRALRGVVALLWASTGVAGAAVAQGRLGALVALIVLPAVMAGLVLLARPTGTATGAFATGLAAALLGAFAPPLLVIVLLFSVGLAFFGVAGTRLRALTPAIVSVLLLGPWVADVLDNWHLAATGPGLSQWGSTTVEPWALALLHAGGAGSTPWWAGAALVVVGVVGLLASHRVRSVPTGAALLALISLAAVLAAPHLELAMLPAAADGQPSGAVTPWAGTFMLPLALALIGAAAAGVESVRRAEPRRRLVRVLPGTAVTVVGLLGAAALGWFGFGSALSTWSDPRPAVAVEQAGNDLANRTVFVTPGPGGAAYRIVGRETGSLARSLPQSVANDAVIAREVSSLLDGTRVDGGPALARHAVGFVALAEGSGDDVTRRLDSTQGLSRLATRAGYDVWRVAATGNGANRPVAPSRLSLVTGDDLAAVPASGDHAATDTSIVARAGDLLTVAQPRDWAQHARVALDGRTLTPVTTSDAEDSAEIAYALPAGRHQLSIDLPTEHPWWRLVQGLALLAVGFMAVPFGTRASRRSR